MGGKILNYFKGAGHALWTMFKSIKTWQLILILIPMLFISDTLLRFDHLKMVELRTAVLAADEAENDEQIAATMQELKTFVNHHIVVNIVEKNGLQSLTFGTGPFYLEHQYVRKATEELAKAEQQLQATGDTNPNGNIFAAAMAVCQPLAHANGWTWQHPAYLNCYTTELAKYPTQDTLTTTLTANIPSTSLYRYDFASPVWSPSTAGFAILIAVILIVVIFIRFLLWLILRLAIIFLKNR